MSAIHRYRSRLFSATAVTLAASLALAGCSQTDEEKPDDSTSSETTETDETATDDAEAATESLLPAAEGAVEYPLTITTPWGESTLEERPERIVALNGTGTDVELLAAIGVTPVLAPNTYERALWTQEAVPGEIEEILDWNGLEGDAPFEAIAAAEPDLIVYTGIDLTEHFDRLTSIAPVIGGSETDGSVDWRKDIVAVGEALDLADAAKKATDDYDAKFEQLRQENPDFEGKTVSFLIQYSEEYGTSYSSIAGSDIEKLFLDLGFAPNPNAEQFVDDNDVSPELVKLVDADVIIIGANADPAETERLLTGTELFQQLPAVKAGHWAVFYGTDGGYLFEDEEHPGNINWALAHGGSLLGKEWAVDQLVPVLRSALELD